MDDTKYNDSVFFNNLFYKIKLVIESDNYTHLQKIEAIDWLIKQADKSKVNGNEN